MKPHLASLLNAILLISLSVFGYFLKEDPSTTALIPGILGLIILAFNPGLKKENKLQAHIAVTVTLIAFIGLFKPLLGAIDRDETSTMLRIILTMLSSILAIYTFIMSFRNARIAREKEQIKSDE